MSIPAGARVLGLITLTDSERLEVLALARRIVEGDEQGHLTSGHVIKAAVRAIHDHDLLACAAATQVIRGLLDIEKEHGNPMSVDYLRGIHDTLGLAMEHLAHNRMTGGDVA